MLGATVAAALGGGSDIATGEPPTVPPQPTATIDASSAEIARLTGAGGRVAADGCRCDG